MTERLPVEILELLCSYFTGFDAFHLSLTNSWWRYHLSGISFWKRCLRCLYTNPEAVQSWKRQYIQARSILFKPVELNNGACPFDSFAYFTNIEDPNQEMYFQFTHMCGKSFSFDIWFSLLPASCDEHFGGIIYGIQSSSRESFEQPHYHQQCVMVSSTGDLYCSVLPNHSIVASNLKPNLWYHVALTYNHEEQRQEVYVNGINVQSKTGVWRYSWHYMMYGQVGTGWSSSDLPNCPRPDYCGWFGFHGILDTFRVWNGVLAQEDITSLANGRIMDKASLQACLKQHQLGRIPGNARLVKCTRISEAAKVQLIN
ncbi:hypothetical protein L915_07041 [Phytophthora nicotianae]|uniref:F-box domain-containing protein n=1 Tax=Phytophthora nicotianae TaxID=4792 RepID=W2H0R8_PHYNI|nr:hypothetical protein L915_07041 [Phytophthora nicotianae]